MNALQLVQAMPPGHPVLAEVAREAVAIAAQDAQREPARLAAERQQTIWMWEDICTRHLCEAPAWDRTDPTAAPGRTLSAPEA